MALYIHPRSSLPLLERMGSKLKRAGRLSLDDSEASVACLMEAMSSVPVFGLLRSPVHLFVDGDEKRCCNDWISCHRAPSAARCEGAFLQINAELFVSSPELCFLMLVRTMGKIDHVRLGYELCSTYRLDPRLERGFAERQPLTSTEQLASFLAAAPDCPEKAAALENLRWIADGSASPRETATAMMASLPTKMGGWGFAKPVLNAVPEGVQGRRVDLFWPDRRFGVEYDSDEEHVGADALARDSRREKEIELQGVRLARFTNGEMKSEEGRMILQRTLSKGLGKRWRSPSLLTKFLQRRLAMTLLAPHATML